MAFRLVGHLTELRNFPTQPNSTNLRNGPGSLVGRGSRPCPPQAYVFTFISLRLLTLTKTGLQSESKTLARRLSAISLPSGDEARSPPGSKVLNPQKHHLDQVQVQQQHQQKAKTQTQTLRQRTYSSPKNPHPTRIPKARQMSGGSISANGHGRQRHPPSQENTPKLKQMPPSSSSDFDMPRSHTRGLGLLHESPPFLIDSMSSSSSAEGGLYAHAKGQRYGLGLGHTQTHDDTVEQSQTEEDPRRPSIDSEERPYEHWYRGEVSRNGGVGELKVGRRQEMLDIANYGHLIRSRKAGGGKGGVGAGKNAKGVGGGAGNRENGYLDLLRLRRKRPRAGSIGGLTRKERDSLYLDEMDEDGAGVDGFESWRGVEDGGFWGERVLDQDPPTDFDKDDDDDDEEEDEEEPEENDEDEQSTPTTRQVEESHTLHNGTHNLNHNYQEPQSDDDDFVFINHPPPTSDTQPYPYAYAYIPTEADVLNIRSSTSDSTSNTSTSGTANTNAGEMWTPTAGAHQTQKPFTYPTNSTTPPTATPVPPLPRPSSRQTQASAPPSRIPHPSSSSRRSSDSRSTYNGTSTPTPATTTLIPRATTPTSIPPRPTRSKSEPPSSLGGASASTSNTTSTPQSAPPSSFNNRSTSPGSTSTSSSPSPSQLTPTPSVSKKGPNNTNSRTKTNSKPRAKPKSKSKPPPTKREEKSDKRSSVAMYPTVEGGEELADAIPSWTQPLTREGNWDDVRVYFFSFL